MRNKSLDLMKIFACFSVVILHVTLRIYNYQSNYSLSSFLFYLAGFAVPLFFMVNGNLLLNKKNMSYRYAVKKILNIALVVFFWNVICFLITLVSTGKFENPIVMTVKSLIQLDYFWQFWFFGALMLIYLILPILYRNFNHSLKTAIAVTGFFIFISVLIDLATLIAGFRIHTVILKNVIQSFRIWLWLAYYMLGGLLGKKQVKEYFVKHINFKANWALLIVFTAALNAFEFFISRYYYLRTSPEYFFGNLIFFAWLVSLFMLIYRHDSLEKEGKGIQLFNRNVMGIYIVHITVINFYTAFFQFNDTLTNTFLIFLTFFTSLLISEIIGRIPVINRLIKI